VGFPNSNLRSVFELDPLRDARWPALIKRHIAASVFHSAEWLSALKLAYGYEPVVYATCRPSVELTSGIVFCKVKSWLTGRRLVSIPFSNHCDSLVRPPRSLVIFSARNLHRCDNLPFGGVLPATTVINV
jgi:hypothetical protein